MPRITVSKLDAAKRQLHAAIRLWFDEGDPVAIHTLAHAAHEIVHRLFRLKGQRGLLFDSPRVRKDKRQLWSSALKRHANFFKHIAHDAPDAEIEFNPAINELLLFITAAGLDRIGEPRTVEESAIGFWCLAHHPDLFLPEAGIDRMPVQVLERVRQMSRREFFEEFRVGWGKGWFPGSPGYDAASRSGPYRLPTT